MIVTVDRFCRFELQLDRIDVLILDDLSATIRPILKTAFQMQQTTLHLNPEVFHFTLLGFETRIDYFSPKIGDWEPFVEQFNVSLTYRSVNRPHETNKPREDAIVPIVVDESRADKQQQLQYASQSLPKYPHLPGHSHIAAQAVFRQPQSPGIKIGRSAAPQKAPVALSWSARFTPTTTVSIYSLSPVLINITPQLCHLLVWFVPTLSGYLTATSLVTEDSPLIVRQATVIPRAQTSSIDNLETSLESVNVGLPIVYDEVEEEKQVGVIIW